MSNKKRIILSLNGGGTLGYISAKIVERIEIALGKPSYEVFSMITGVSTGSILGSMLAMGHSAGVVSNFYSKEGSRIFGSPRWMPWKAKYNKDVLHGVMKEYMNVPISHVKVPLMYYAVRIDKPHGGVKFWKSWKDSDVLCDTVIASCSAPTYFAPWTYNGGVYIDGGIYTNNPSMNAIAEGIKLGWNLEDIVVVNIAVDSWVGVDRAPKIDGLLEWITRITMTTMGVSQQAVEYHSSALLGNERHYVIQTPRFLKIDSLDFNEMDRIVDETWERKGLPALQTLFKALDD